MEYDIFPYAVAVADDVFLWYWYWGIYMISDNRYAGIDSESSDNEMFCPFLNKFEGWYMWSRLDVYI